MATANTTPGNNDKPIYAIGDVQGCGDCLQRLIENLPDANQAQFWFVGDLVNRGPDSVGALRFIKQLGNRAITVLGNHDLHLLATACAVRPASRRDTLDSVLNAPDREELIDWLRRQPLVHLQANRLLVHAGIHPDWTAKQAITYAAEVQTVLRSNDWAAFLKDMYGDRPAIWEANLTGTARLRAIVNVLTRMRMINQDGSLDMDFKDDPRQAPASMQPWFDVPGRATAQTTTIIFGHWSTLGLLLRENLMALDTGCVWGGQLTAVRLTDCEVFQEQCPAAQDPVSD